MDYSLSNLLRDDMPTKEKIMICALDLFCKKGYAETSIRDIATSVGITAGTIYGHYSSKDKLLQTMLNEYAENTKDMFSKFDIAPILKEKPTGEGISLCLVLSISLLTKDVYYSNLVHLIHQEQHRNSLFGSFVLLRMQDTKDFVGRIFDFLKEMKVIKADADADLWGAFAYSVFHTISSCIAISISSKTPGYAIADIKQLFHHLFNAAIETNKFVE